MPFKNKIDDILLAHINLMEPHYKIKFIRLSKNLTQGYLADALGIDVAIYSRLERGETNISINRLQKIAELLEVNVSSLIENDEEIDKLNPVKLEGYLKEILKELKSINNKINKNNIYENN